MVIVKVALNERTRRYMKYLQNHEYITKFLLISECTLWRIINTTNFGLDLKFFLCI